MEYQTYSEWSATLADKVKDEYVRRDDLGTHMEHVTTGLADVKTELQRTNTRLDELLKPSKS